MTTVAKQSKAQAAALTVLEEIVLDALIRCNTFMETDPNPGNLLSEMLTEVFYAQYGLESPYVTE